MTDFAYRDGQLCCEEVPLAALAAAHGTPLYVYSRAAILGRYRAFTSAFRDVSHVVCFAMKANDHLAILRLLGIDRGVVALTKIDAVDEDTLALAEEEARELVPGADVVRVSARTGEGLDGLRAALGRVADSIEHARADRP